MTRSPLPVAVSTTPPTRRPQLIAGRGAVMGEPLDYAALNADDDRLREAIYGPEPSKREGVWLIAGVIAALAVAGVLAA